MSKAIAIACGVIVAIPAMFFASSMLIPSLVPAPPSGSHLPEFIVLLVVALMYLSPTFVAALRKKSNTGAILVLNFFLGWTFVGWVIAMTWACTANPTPPPPVHEVS